ncbi:hypothetical protein M1446_01035 [Candidatus Dependentiae bacterium]|nr:hypothetical protein [Candidatus Dependentiae bacterium]
MKSKNLMVFVCIALIGLAGCARYQAKSLNKIDTSIFSLSQNSQEKFVSFSYHIFDTDDCMKYLDRNVIAKGYQPIQITITNNTNRYLNISMSNFSLPYVSSEEVAKRVHTSTVKRSVGYGILGLFIWPFLVPAIVDGIGSSEANRKLDADFAKKTLKDKILRPYSTINGLIFVPVKKFKKDFTFTIVDEENHERFVLGATNHKIKI